MRRTQYRSRRRRRFGSRARSRRRVFFGSRACGRSQEKNESFLKSWPSGPSPGLPPPGPPAAGPQPNLRPLAPRHAFRKPTVHFAAFARALGVPPWLHGESGHIGSEFGTTPRGFQGAYPWGGARRPRLKKTLVLLLL